MSDSSFRCFSSALQNSELKSELEVSTSTLIIGGTFSLDLVKLSKLTSVTVYQPWRLEFDRLQAAGIDVVNKLPEERTFTFILSLGTRYKLYNYFLFTYMIQRVDETGLVACVMDNTLGAKRFNKDFAALMGNSSSYSKHKARLFWSKKELINEDLFIKYKKQGEPLRIPETPLCTVPGIFSHGRIDQGSHLLAQSLPPLKGKVADFGCGYGYLSWRILETMQLTSLSLFDADAKAIKIAKKNLQNYTIPVHFEWLDLSNKTLLDGFTSFFDAIVINPPFHQDSKENKQLGLKMIHHGLKCLRREGDLYYVANISIPYERWLKEHGIKSTIINEENGYKIVHITSR